MNRRTFVRSVAGSAVMLSVPEIMVRSATARAAEIDERLNNNSVRKLADIALSTAKKLGASYADIRVCRYQHQSINTREERVEGINEATDFGFGVRVLVDGTWGFSSSNNVTEAQIEKVARAAVEMARANKLIQKMPVELEKLPAYHDEIGRAHV